MNTTRVTIEKGMLIERVYASADSDVDYIVEYTLTREDGSLVSGSYRGEAAEIVEHGKRYLVIAVGCQMERVLVGGPTVESKEQADGFFFGMAQKRRVAPNGKSDAFLDGWRAAWSERRPFKF